MYLTSVAQITNQEEEQSIGLTCSFHRARLHGVTALTQSPDAIAAVLGDARVATSSTTVRLSSIPAGAHIESDRKSGQRS